MEMNHTNTSPCHFTACLSPSVRVVHHLSTYVCSVLLRFEKQSKHGAGAVHSALSEEAEEQLRENQTFTPRWVGGFGWTAWICLC